MDYSWSVMLHDICTVIISTLCITLLCFNQAIFHGAFKIVEKYQIPLKENSLIINVM